MKNNNNKTYGAPNISDILELIENIPINNKLETKIDKKVSLDNNHRILAQRLGLTEYEISFRDIINFFIKFIKGIYLVNIEKTAISMPAIRLEELRKIGCTYPAQYLLFDFCLAALEEDLLDAKLFLAHAFNIIGLSNQLNLLLSAIVYTPLTSDNQVKELLTLLALEVQPANIESYLELYGKEFKNRYQIYETEIMKLK